MMDPFARDEPIVQIPVFNVSYYNIGDAIRIRDSKNEKIVITYGVIVKLNSYSITYATQEGYEAVCKVISIEDYFKGVKIEIIK